MSLIHLGHAAQCQQAHDVETAGKKLLRLELRAGHFLAGTIPLPVSAVEGRQVDRRGLPMREPSRVILHSSASTRISSGPADPSIQFFVPELPASFSDI